MSAFFPAALLFSLTLTWLRASWSAGTPRLRHVRIDRPVFMSGGAFELSLSSQARLSRSATPLLRWNRAPTCSGYPQQGHLASSGSSAPVCAPVHLHDVLIAPSRKWNLLRCVAVFWHCISGHCTSAGTSNVHALLLCNFSDLPYLLSGTVDVLHLWQLQQSLHFVDLVSPDTESGEF